MHKGGQQLHDLPSLHELMQISLEPFDSQRTGVVARLNEDYLFESKHSSLPITWMHPFCWICPSALHPAPHMFRHHSCVNLVVVPQWAPKLSHILTERLTRYHFVYTTKGCQHCHWSVGSLLCVNLPIVGTHCWTPRSSPHVITRDLVNLTIFCYYSNGVYPP